MMQEEWQQTVVTQGGGYGPPPGGYGPPGGMPPGGGSPGGYGPPGGGGYGPPGGGGYNPPGGGYPPGGPAGYGPPGGGAPMGGPPGGSYGQPMAPPGGGGMLGGPPGAGNQELSKQAKTWLIISAVSAVVCCNGCFGIIAAVLCYLAMTAADQGNTADAEAKLKWGKIIAIVGMALGVLGLIGYAAQMLLYAAS